MVKEIPNFTGVIARPRLRCGCSAFHSRNSSRRAANSLDSFNSCQIALNAVVLDFLAVMRRVRLARSAIKIRSPHDFRREPESARDAIDDFLDHQHSLRPAETAKGGVRGEIGFGDAPAEFDVRNVVGVVEMEHGAIGHRTREIERPAAIGIRVRSSPRGAVPSSIKADARISRETDGVSR